MNRIIPLVCVIALVCLSILANRKSSHRNPVVILGLLITAGCIPAWIYCWKVLYLLLLAHILLRLVCVSRWEESFGVSSLMQCLVMLLLALLGHVTGTYGWTSVLLAILFLTIRLREGEVLSRFENYSAVYQNRLLQNQVEEVQHMYTTMRGWRHDYHSHLQSLKAKLNKQLIAESIQYLDELEQSLKDIHLMVECGNVNVDAILNSKLSLAVEQGIEVNLKVSIPPVLPISDTDCCVLLGNLIDNAIEACEKVDGKKYIRLYIGLYKKQLYISITNATHELVRKFDEEYITTKRGNHGHGLKRINTVVEKYGGFVNRKNEPGVFVCEIMLPIGC